MRVLDGGVLVLDGVAGVEAQTETVWAQAGRYAVSRLLFVSKLDREGASAERALATVRSRLGGRPLLVSLPGTRAC